MEGILKVNKIAKKSIRREKKKFKVSEAKE